MKIFLKFFSEHVNQRKIDTDNCFMKRKIIKAEMKVRNSSAPAYKPPNTHTHIHILTHTAKIFP